MDQPFEAQLRAPRNMIPAYTWSAGPSGPLTFGQRTIAAHLGLPKDHPLRLCIESGAAWIPNLPDIAPDIGIDPESLVRLSCGKTGSPGEVL